MATRGPEPGQGACLAGRRQATGGRSSLAAVVLVAVSAAPLLGASAADDFGRPASWTPPSPAAVRERAMEWLAGKTASMPDGPTVLRRAAAVWDARFGADGSVSATGMVTADVDIVDTVMEILALGDPRLAEVWQQSGGLAAFDRSGRAGPRAIPVDEPWLDDPSVAGFERDTVRLWLGRLLVRHDRFDDALPLLVGLDVEESIDPATLLFHRAACQHWLLEADAASDALDQLLERADEIPARYERVGRLLRADLAALDEDSLDHVARRMRDVTRRLGLGRAGTATRTVQDGVVASLDRMIKEIEDQQQSSGGGGGGGAGQGGGAAPMDDSRLAGGRGAGEVRSRDLGGGDGWGNLPPQAREEALQQIGREFPPHYREAIEQYFKRLATGAEDR